MVSKVVPGGATQAVETPIVAVSPGVNVRDISKVGKRRVQ